MLSSMSLLPCLLQDLGASGGLRVREGAAEGVSPAPHPTVIRTGGRASDAALAGRTAAMRGGGSRMGPGVQTLGNTNTRRQSRREMLSHLEERKF